MNGQPLFEQHEERIVNLEDTVAKHENSLILLETKMDNLHINLQSVSEEVKRGNLLAEKNSDFQQKELSSIIKEVFKLSGVMTESKSAKETRADQLKSKNYDSFWKMLLTLSTAGGFIYLIADKLIK